MRFGDLRIGVRLQLSNAALLLLTLSLAGVSIKRLDDLSRSMREAVEHRQQTLARSQSVNMNAEIAARKLLVLIGAPREGRVAAYKAIDEANRRLDEAVAMLRLANVAERVHTVFPVVEERLRAFRADYANTVDLIEADDLLAARRAIGGRTEASLTALVEALGRYNEAEQAELDHNAVALQELVARDRQIVLALCTAALVLGLTLSALVARGIVRPLALTKTSAQRIAAGHYEHRLDDRARDEVGALSRSLNQLAQAVADREAARVDAAETEALTRLPGRTRFLREGQALLHQRDQQGSMALLICLDVDRLKSINAVLGFEAGDALLKVLASRLRDACDQQSVLGRLSGGALVALLPIEADHDVSPRISRLQADLEHSLDWRGHTLDVAVTLGAAMFPADCADPAAQGSGIDLLLQRAEAAMYEAKRAKVRCMRFDPRWERARESHLSLLSALRVAVEQDHLRQFLQPKVDAVSGALVGAEALVRWQHPTRGFISPGEFIPFAEQTGRIRDLTRWMLRRAIRNLAHLPALQAPGCYLAVNISTLDLLDTDLPAWLATQLEAGGVDPSRLQLEVTESGLLASGNGPVKVLTALRAVGVTLALDDFGTGQSSLAYLQRLPVQELKIDRSFVSNVDHDTRRQNLLNAIVDLGHSLGLTVTAEGVETVGELQVLRRCGVDLIQGYLISEPINEDDFAGQSVLA
ncbi:putative bifunctional diguanylate cyclase/phosphodiesterase [Roseateles saccharophilus]|uniref:Diguanylate cyclase (GGDEF)-like protein n=1 Tax=Roseateles saccharophilus TaxID=304 RepID=A0A4R3VMN2_ROSSA|nr:EAL domain-containing protein [Roseateles saccharophilus]MDG0831296.1 EAL domain-containing protein [Roseateles saccharophilus]TCV04425.1 diguanylate cyclase (GGDEF)-like protein [Roseateles saccharophilus]